MSDVEFIFGGSFDPVHFGHLHIIDSLQELGTHWPIRVLPCSVPALKKQTSATFAQRVEMIHLAVKDYENVTIDQREGARAGKSYSYDTLCQLTDEFSGRRLILVIGSDNLGSIGEWSHANQLASLCHLLVVNRPNSSVEQQQEQLIKLGFESTHSHLQLASKPSGLFYCYTITERETSSTAIREWLKQSRSANTFVNQSAQNKTSESNKIAKSDTDGLVEQQQDTAFSAPATKAQNRKIEALNIETPAAVRDYIKDNSIYW